MTFEIKIRGVTVNLPYKPFLVQEDFMTKVIECLQLKKDGILESPVGTGRTLSLLCSSLAWLDQQLIQMRHQRNSAHPEIKTLGRLCDNKEGFTYPKVIYCSRTHSQLSHVVEEFKKTSYQHRLLSVVLGSREQLCIHNHVKILSDPTNKLHVCRAKVTTQTCSYYLNVEHKLKVKDDTDNLVLDIEDLVKLGENHECCPYYASSGLKNKADILFTPYNNILDDRVCKAQGIELHGNVVIFEEGHDIPKACEDSMSFQLGSKDVASCVKELDEIIQQMKCEVQFPELASGIIATFSLTEVVNLRGMFSELYRHLNEHIAPRRTNSLTEKGDFIFDVLSRVELTVDKMNVTLFVLDKLILYLSTLGIYHYHVGRTGLQTFSDMLKIIRAALGEVESCSAAREIFAKNYCISIDCLNLSTDWNANALSGMKDELKGWVLHGWCLFPELRMSNLKALGIHSMILTSGMLAPLHSFVKELGIPISVCQEYPHIISNEQILASVIPYGPDQSTLNSSSANRSSQRYLDSLGNTILNVSRVVPGGLLVFFSSYKALHDSVKFWQKSQLWNSMVLVKPIFVEVACKRALKLSLQEYYSIIQGPQSRGATFFGVFQGKVSETLNFFDHNARTIIITGLPFPPRNEVRIKTKLHCLDKAKEMGLNSRDWYLLQAIRAVNQVIGQLIRHNRDFGAILFCDNQFTELRTTQQLPKWISSRLRVYPSFSQALGNVTKFFKMHRVGMVLSFPGPLSKNAFECGETSMDKVPSNATLTVLNHQQPQRLPVPMLTLEGIICEKRRLQCDHEKGGNAVERIQQNMSIDIDPAECTSYVHPTVPVISTNKIDQISSNLPLKEPTAKKRKLYGNECSDNADSESKKVPSIIPTSLGRQSRILPRATETGVISKNHRLPVTNRSCNQQQSWRLLAAAQTSEDIILENQRIQRVSVGHEDGTNAVWRKQQHISIEDEPDESTKCPTVPVISASKIKQVSSNLPSKESTVNKRKLVFKLQGDAESGPSVKPNIKSGDDWDSRLKPFQTVKIILSPLGKYHLFLKAVKTYAQDRNTKKFAKSTGNVFQSVPVGCQLLEKLSKFVSEEERPLFLGIVKKIHPSFAQK